MPETARQMRSRRQHWAVPGSGHDRLVGSLRIVLPAAVGVVAAMMVFLPLTGGKEVSFVLDKNKVETSKERLRVEAASYRGQDNKGQPFLLTAQKALQKSAQQPVIAMRQLAAKLQLTEGPATLEAPGGRFDPNTQQVDVDGPIVFNGPDGYSIRTNSAKLDMKSKTMQGQGGVTGTVRQGNFSADSMHADLDNRTISLDGRARLHIDRRRAK